MSAILASTKPPTSVRRMKTNLDTLLLTNLADPSKCDGHLARRLAKALDVSETPATARPITKGKQKSVPPGSAVEERRRLAMRAANATSQGLGKVVQSGWKALNHKAAPAFSMESVLSIVSSFRIAIVFLRETDQGAIEVERVASGFVGKLIAVQLYEPALELLDPIRAHIIRKYNGLSSSPAPTKRTVSRGASKPSFMKYIQLVQYPHPAPEDPNLLALICASLSQALTAVTAVVPLPPATDAFLETFIAVVEGAGGPISWHTFVSTEHAEALLGRVHRVLATTFSSANTPANLLLKLRALALRSLLCRSTLDRDQFWTQATDYMATHGKSAVKTEDIAKAVKDVVAFFESIIVVARGRQDATTLMSGSAFVKFCDVALIFAKRGDIASLNTVTQFINADCAGKRPPTDELIGQGVAIPGKRPDEFTALDVTYSLSHTASTVESLCSLAKSELSPGNAATYATSFDHLQRAVTLLDAYNMHEPTTKTDVHLAVPLSRVMYALAGSFWNNAVVLYQNGKYAASIRFLVQGCEMTVKVCHMAETVVQKGSNRLMDAEPWKTLKSHLPKRWELLGDCYSRIGERRLAHGAFLESLKSWSFEVLCRSAACSSPNQLLVDDNHRRLASLVERITHIAVFDLLMRDEASLRQALCTMQLDREAIGIILEWEAACLEQHSWKSEVPYVLHCVLRDALDLYGPEFPIRRARVLIQQLDLAYRVDDLSFPVDDIMAEIHDLLSQDTGKDAAFVDMQPRYRAIAHMWAVLHAHRRFQGNSHSIIILHHATQASKILRSMFPSALPSGHAKSLKLPPKAVVTKSTKSAARASPRKKRTTVTVDPVTPKPRRLAMQSSFSPRTRETLSSESSPTKSARSTADGDLIRNIQMIAQLMGLLGHVVLKIQFLNVLQRMTERSAGPSADDFVHASVEAANEYVRLGKIQRAMAIYRYALAAINCVAPPAVSDEVRVTLLLHYAASHALNGSVEKSSSLYEEARVMAQNIESPQLTSTAARIRTRVLTLERSALASNVFAAIQIAQDDPYAAFSTLRQSLRLWNRALDALSRLSPSPAPTSSNPFDMTSLTEALPATSGGFQKDNAQSKRSYHQSTPMCDIQWRIAGGLLHTLFGLGRAHFLQGTVRGAEYYIEQARDLAQSLHLPGLLSRALAKKGELQLHQGKLEDAATTLLEASELLQKTPGIDAADLNRLRAHHSQLMEKHKEAEALYIETVEMLSELEKMLAPVESITLGSSKLSPTQLEKSHHSDVLVPGLLAAVLRQQIWLQRNEPRDKTKAYLDKISALPPSRETKAEEFTILAKLALHGAQVQFRTDLFLSSLTESTIALPMGASSPGTKLSHGARQMLETLSMAEKMFWDSLELVSHCGQASDVREAAISLALIRSFRTTLGKSSPTGARVVARLLDASAAIALRRELINEIDYKFPELGIDDLTWPSAMSRSPVASHPAQVIQNVVSSEDADAENTTVDLETYWRAVRHRCYSFHDFNDQASSQVDLLPPHWTVVSISITEDKSTLFFSRQRRDSEPLIFCVPLERHGRKEDATEQFTYWDAIGQLRGILQRSDASAENAKNILSQDRDAKVAWWAERAALDKQMRELLENIEFCWLGAFKTILSEPSRIQAEVLDDLRVRFENIFKRNLVSDKKRMSRVRLDDSLMECFASLSPRCRDEELEDLIYFFLDLYQFHGFHVALSEIDMDLLLVELRTVLEDHASKRKGLVLPMDDAHLFLVLDKNVQGIPWESIPILRGRSVSRIPSLSFLVDRIELARCQQEPGVTSISSPDRIMVNPRKTFYVLNPSGDLNKSESRFRTWAKEMEGPAAGWQGIVGEAPSEQQLLDAFSRKDLVIYFGHGGAEQYVRSYKIKQLRRCAATMLWGCSSGLMREMGSFDRVGTPYNYMLAGCPTLVACLWDVTDNELDKISRSVFDKLRLDAEHVKSWDSELMDGTAMSVIAAVGQSRDACKLKYLTGAAPVVYGIPFYL